MVRAGVLRASERLGGVGSHGCRAGLHQGSNRCHHVHIGMPLVIECPVGVPEDSVLNINEGGNSREGVLCWAVHGLIVPDDADVHTCHISRMPTDPVAGAPAEMAMESRKTRVLI